jgi:hypothetical protein
VNKSSKPPGDAPPVILIGGTGDVGQRLLSQLIEKTKHRITVFSRSDPRASVPPTGRVDFKRADIAAPGAAALIPAGAVVVNLTEATPPTLAASIVAGGGVFLETSASPDYLESLAANPRLNKGPGTAVFCVGMAPGLTNLMVADLARDDSAADVDVGVEMGLGRHYGAAATEWFLRSAGPEYPLIRGERLGKVRPGEIRRRFAFARHERPRLALGFSFAEQVWLARDPALGLSSVRSFVAIDPQIVTRLLGWLLQAGIGSWISGHAKSLTHILARIPGLGETRTRVVCESRGADGVHLASVRVVTGDQAQATAAMILAVILNLRRPVAMPVGLTTIVDHLTLEQSISVLSGILPETRLDRTRSGTFEP